MTDTIPTLEEMAHAIAEQRVLLTEQEAEAERLRGPYEAAYGRARDTETRLRKMERAMGITKRSYMVGLAIKEAGLDLGDSPLIITDDERTFEITYWELVAVGSENTRLYRRRTRQLGTEYMKLRTDDDVLQDFASLSIEEKRTSGTYEALVRVVRGHENYVYWQERGSGAYGKGSGAIKPKAPPEGGRWRWLKVREQEQLEETS